MALPAEGPRYEIRHGRTQVLVASNARMALGWRRRAVGLLGCDGLASGDALIFPRCRAIHTVGMRFAIDTIFMDRAWRVVGLKAAVPPGRVLWPIWRAWGVIELPVGVIQQRQISVGDQLVTSLAGNLSKT